MEFDDLRDADDAVYELNGKDLCGERVIVEHARGPRRDSSYGSGRSKHLCICIHGLFKIKHCFTFYKSNFKGKQYKVVTSVL